MQSPAIHSLLADARAGDLHHAARTSGHPGRLGHLIAQLRSRVDRSIDRLATGELVAFRSVEIVGHSVPGTGGRRS